MTAPPPPAIPHAALTAGILASMGVPAREPFAVHPPDDAFEPGRVVTFDAAQFADGAPDEFLSHRAVSDQAPDPASPDGLRRYLAPDVASNQPGFVEYPLYHYADHPRAAGADFPTLRHPSCQLVTQRIASRGLAVEVDESAERPDADWRPAKVAFLRGVLDRARLRRTVGLFVAGAVNVGKTWSMQPGPIRTWTSSTSWKRRRCAPRACGTGRTPGPGGRGRGARGTPPPATPPRRGRRRTWPASSPWRKCGPSRARELPGPAGQEDAGVGQVLLFCGDDGLGRNDFSNLKTFVSPARTGGRYAVYLRRVGGSRWRLGVECYETVAITSTMGLEVVTVS